MELHLTHDDFTQGNASTAAILRALAAVLDPAPANVLATQTVKVEVDASAANAAIEALQQRANPVAAEIERIKEVHASLSAPAPEFGLDAQGFPWDERIHASSRATVADGTWKLKRGVDPALVAEVRAAHTPGIPALPAAPTEAERLQTEQEQDVPDPAKVGFGQQVPPPPPAAPEQDWPVDVLGVIPEGKTPFQVFMTWAMARMNDKTLTQPRLLEVINAHGVAQLPVLNSQPEKIPAIVRDLAGA